MGSKTLVRWSKKITPAQVEQLIRAERDIRKALLVFDSATAEYANGYRHDRTTFGVIISRLAAANQFKPAEQLLSRMQDEKCAISEGIFLSLFRAYGKAHKPLDALRVFRKMKEFGCEPTPKAYVTVFDILVSENQLILAHRFHNYMKEMGLPPCVASLNVLIKAFCKSAGTLDAAFRVFQQMPDLGCVPDSYTYGTLINGLCRLGRIGNAKEMFEEMRVRSCTPTVVTYSTLIHGLCQSGNLDEAVDMFKEMCGNGIKPNVVTYSSLMDGLCKGSRSSQAMELLEEMEGKRLLPNMITYSTIVSGLCKESKLCEALAVLDRMKIQGCKPDAGLYSKLINGLCDSCKFVEAANFLDEMVLSGISPNRVTRIVHVKIHNRVVQGLCSKKITERAFQVYLSMRSRGISADQETFNCLVDCLCKKGDVHKAARIVNEMVAEKFIPDEVTWSTIVHGFFGRMKGREAAEFVQLELLREFLDTNTTI
ncbi:hypothetical protein ACLOJK_010382 [Asimina triloba]